MLTEEIKQQIMSNWDGLLTDTRWINGELWGIHGFLFTCAILGDIDVWGYCQRYCYRSEKEAQEALQSWDGEGEPTGWHRALIQGQPIRKMDEEGNIYE